MNNSISGTEPVGWETEAEWQLEQRAFNWSNEAQEEETRALIKDLWYQYCLAANPDRLSGVTLNTLHDRVTGK